MSFTRERSSSNDVKDIFEVAQTEDGCNVSRVSTLAMRERATTRPLYVLYCRHSASVSIGGQVSMQSNTQRVRAARSVRVLFQNEAQKNVRTTGTFVHIGSFTSYYISLLWNEIAYCGHITLDLGLRRCRRF